MAKWAFWMLIATAFSAMFTGIGVILIAFTLKYTKDTLTEAKAATKAANDTVTVTRQIGEDQLRPYVHISAARFYWDHIGPRAIVSCQNSGQTPATFFEIRFHTRAIPVGDEREFIQPPDDVKPLPWPAMGGNCTDTAGLHNEQLAAEADIASRGSPFMNLFIFGVVRYGDIGGAEYESQFAYYSSGIGRTDVGSTHKPVTMIRPTGKLKSFVMVKKPDRASQ